ncbi:hypothetical protein EV210_12319 [Anaerospora hongkongensis]|uniref:Uncharacterized protein n=1 Tax=Anaerospora hongkongensis TaxID=244830 RepID=A0A4V2Q7J9_9FIRM|nr:hypothetical protein [Anaerospora hongkongensis]TCL32199.1 hypothetical protein EV210_12319 [Anaerospora hongkongensis]
MKGKIILTAAMITLLSANTAFAIDSPANVNTVKTMATQYAADVNASYKDNGFKETFYNLFNLWRPIYEGKRDKYDYYSYGLDDSVKINRDKSLRNLGIAVADNMAKQNALDRENAIDKEKALATITAPDGTKVIKGMTDGTGVVSANAKTSEKVWHKKDLEKNTLPDGAILFQLRADPPYPYTGYPIYIIPTVKEINQNYKIVGMSVGQTEIKKNGQAVKIVETAQPGTHLNVAQVTVSVINAFGQQQFYVTNVSYEGFVANAIAQKNGGNSAEYNDGDTCIPGYNCLWRSNEERDALLANIDAELVPELKHTGFCGEVEKIITEDGKFTAFVKDQEVPVEINAKKATYLAEGKELCSDGILRAEKNGKYTLVSLNSGADPVNKQQEKAKYRKDNPQLDTKVANDDYQKRVAAMMANLGTNSPVIAGAPVVAGSGVTPTVPTTSPATTTTVPKPDSLSQADYDECVKKTKGFQKALELCLNAKANSPYNKIDPTTITAELPGSKFAKGLMTVGASILGALIGVGVLVAIGFGALVSWPVVLTGLGITALVVMGAAIMDGASFNSFAVQAADYVNYVWDNNKGELAIEGALSAAMAGLGGAWGKQLLKNQAAKGAGIKLGERLSYTVTEDAIRIPTSTKLDTALSVVAKTDNLANISKRLGNASVQISGKELLQLQKSCKEYLKSPVVIRDSKRYEDMLANLSKGRKGAKDSAGMWRREAFENTDEVTKPMLDEGVTLANEFKAIRDTDALIEKMYKEVARNADLGDKIAQSFIKQSTGAVTGVATGTINTIHGSEK